MKNWMIYLILGLVGLIFLGFWPTILIGGAYMAYRYFANRPPSTKMGPTYNR